MRDLRYDWLITELGSERPAAEGEYVLRIKFATMPDELFMFVELLTAFQFTALSEQIDEIVFDEFLMKSEADLWGAIVEARADGMAPNDPRRLYVYLREDEPA